MLRFHTLLAELLGRWGRRRRTEEAEGESKEERRRGREGDQKEEEAIPGYLEPFRPILSCLEELGKTARIMRKEALGGEEGPAALLELMGTLGRTA